MVRRAVRLLLAAVTVASVLIHGSIQLWGVGSYVVGSGGVHQPGWWMPMADSLIPRWLSTRRPALDQRADGSVITSSVTVEWPYSSSIASDGPPYASDEPSYASDEPPHASDEPPHASFEPPHASVEPPHASDEPPHASDEPPHASDEPPHASDEPPYSVTTPLEPPYSVTTPAVTLGASNEPPYSVTTPPVVTLDPTVRFVTGYFGVGRLGNNMFVYASVLGVALRHSLRVAYCLEDQQLASYQKLRSLFRVTVTAGHCSFASDRMVAEKGWGLYNGGVDSSQSFGRRTFVYMYLQSYKYFDAYRRHVAREFELTPPYAAQADDFLRRAAGGRANATFVGVHVRRGDMVARDLYNAAPESFIGRAMDLYSVKYGGSARVLVFVVASDDLVWTSAAMLRLNRTSDVVYAGSSTEGDLAILSRCNHSVVTSGSYGWWAAWLAGGDVIYYRNFMPNSSRLYAEYAPEDYYPPRWTGLD